jgi:hypothetical protein
MVPAFGAKAHGVLVGNVPTSSMELLAVRASTSSARRRAIVCVPQGFLFKTAAPEKKAREHLIEGGYLEAVIQFPSGLLKGTSISFALLVITPLGCSESVTICQVDREKDISGQGKLRSQDRRFTGADRILEALRKPHHPDFVVVKVDTLKNENYQLLFDKYANADVELLLGGEHNVSTLGELVTIVKPQHLADVDPESDGAQIFREIGTGDLAGVGYVNLGPLRYRSVDQAQFDMRPQQILKPDDILLTVKGRVGRVGLISENLVRNIEDSMMPSLSIVILRLKSTAPIMDPKALGMYLRSPAVQSQLFSLAYGETVSNMSLTELRSLPVRVPDEDAQRALIEAFDRQIEVLRDIYDLNEKNQGIAEELWNRLGLKVNWERTEPESDRAASTP